MGYPLLLLLVRNLYSYLDLANIFFYLTAWKWSNYTWSRLRFISLRSTSKGGEFRRMAFRLINDLIFLRTLYFSKSHPHLVQLQTFRTDMYARSFIPNYQLFKTQNYFCVWRGLPWYVHILLRFFLYLWCQSIKKKQLI